MAVQNYIKPKSKYPLKNTFASYSGITISSFASRHPTISMPYFSFPNL